MEIGLNRPRQGAVVLGSFIFISSARGWVWSVMELEVFCWIAVYF